MFRAALPRLESLLLLDQSKNRFELTGPGYLEHKAGDVFVSGEPSVIFSGEPIPD